MTTVLRRPRAVIVAGLATVLLGGTAAMASVATESMTAHVTTAHPTVGQPLNIAGQVAGAASYPVTVTATRDDSTGSATPVGTPVMSDSQGNFTIEDNPPARGQVTYHLSADAGAATADVQTQVAGKPTDLSITAKPGTADANTSVHVTAHLGSPTTDRTVSLYAQPYQQSRQQFDSGPVDASGNRAADHAVQRRTTFVATFAGDSAYAPASAVVTVHARAVIDSHLQGGSGTKGGYRLYSRNANVNVFIHLQPEYKGACIVMRAQRKSGGSWHSAAVSNCRKDVIRTNAGGEVIAQLQPPHVAGVPYRLRAEFRGGNGVSARNGDWLYLRFQG
jgi:hypothetical protein